MEYDSDEDNFLLFISSELYDVNDDVVEIYIYTKDFRDKDIVISNA